MVQQRKLPLTKELSFYERKKGEWLGSHAGEFALIDGEHAAGFFPTYEAAFEAGIERFGLSKEFLIKQVVEHEPVFVIY